MVQRSDEYGRVGSGGFITTGRVASVLLGLATIFVVTMAGKIWQPVNADQITVIQSLGGKLSVYTDPGWRMQWFGTVTEYRKRNIYRFQQQVRFNDGGHGTISGSVQYDMPRDNQHMLHVHESFGSQDAVDQQLIKTITDKAIYSSGPTMSSTESYASKRNLLLQYIEDQIKNGVYETRVVEEEVVDEATNEKKTVRRATIVNGADGKPARVEEAVLPGFGIQAFSFAINDIDYEDLVDKQIAKQQEMTAGVITSIAEARMAQQRRTTAEAEGQAKVMEARYKQEEVKITAVTLAQQQREVAETEAKQKLEVARLGAEAMEQYRIGELKRADADSTYRRKMIEANGALDQRLAAYIEVAKVNAEAIKGVQGNLVPTIIMGGAGATQTAASPIHDLLSMLNAKTATDLAVLVNPRQQMAAVGQ